MRIEHGTRVAFLLWLGLSSLALAGETTVSVVALADEVPYVPYDAGFVKFLVPSASTEGRTAVLELKEMPGFETPWHKHESFDETFHVMEGTLTLKLGDETLTLPAGSTVFIPRGTPHAQGNPAGQPVRLLTTFSPGGFDQFFVDRTELFKRAKRGTPEFSEGMRELRKKHAQWIQAADP